MNLTQRSPSASSAPQQTIAVLIPCFNEAACIADVVHAFSAALPTSTIYVYDNASNDSTSTIARNAGATVAVEPLRGKGNVVRRMFADVEADIYVLVDGDNTYDAASAPEMVRQLAADSLDMIVGARVANSGGAFRTGHRFGNRVLSRMVRQIFGNQIRDLLSGYRVMSRRFVKSFPALSSGFEIETELTIHALELRAPVREIATPYYERLDGSHSKLHTVRDGVRILRTILRLIKDERPFGFFSLVAVLLFLGAVAIGIPILNHYLDTGLVPRLPSAILATGLGIMGFLSFLAGLILDSVTRGRRETKRLLYLATRQRRRSTDS